MLVQALYQWQLAGHDFDELMRQFEEQPEFPRVDQLYFRELLGVVLAESDTLDSAISQFAARGLDQLDAVGRSVLLLALAELKHRHDVPTKVVINEAIELAKRFGATDSYRFVNAVLDKASRSDDYRPDAGR